MLYIIHKWSTTELWARDSQWNISIKMNDSLRYMFYWSPVQSNATLLANNSTSYVTCCVSLHTLLHVVACSWELLLKVWNRSNVWANNPQHFFCPNIGSCCIRLHTTANKDATTPNIVGLVRSLKDKTDVKDVFTLVPNVPCPNNYSK